MFLWTGKGTAAAAAAAAAPRFPGREHDFSPTRSSYSEITWRFGLDT